MVGQSSRTVERDCCGVWAAGCMLQTIVPSRCGMLSYLPPAEAKPHLRARTIHQENRQSSGSHKAQVRRHCYAQTCVGAGLKPCMSSTFVTRYTCRVNRLPRNNSGPDTHTQPCPREWQFNTCRSTTSDVSCGTVLASHDLRRCEGDMQ